MKFLRKHSSGYKDGLSSIQGFCLGTIPTTDCWNWEKLRLDWPKTTLELVSISSNVPRSATINTGPRRLVGLFRYWEKNVSEFMKKFVAFFPFPKLISCFLPFFSTFKHIDVPFTYFLIKFFHYSPDLSYTTVGKS